MQTKKEVAAFLDHLYFLSEDGRAAIERMIDLAPDAAMPQISAALRRTKIAQDASMAETMSRDPGFAHDLQSFIHDAFVGIKHQYEQTERQDISSILDRPT